MDLKELANLPILKFKEKKLFTEAITHRSYSYENIKVNYSYERLEFLGDSIVNLMVGDFLYKKFPDYEEGKLTELRLKLVCEETFARFSLAIKLDKHIKLGRGAESIRNGNKLLADVFESYIAAVFIDSVDKNLDPINRLQIWAVKRGFETPIYDDLTPKDAPNTNNTEFRFKAIINSKIHKIHRQLEIQKDFIDINQAEWSEVMCPDSVFLNDGLGGFLCLEEIEGIGIEYDEHTGAKEPLSMEVNEDQDKNMDINHKDVNDLQSESEEEEQVIVDNKIAAETQIIEISNEELLDSGKSAWDRFNLSSDMMKGLELLKFDKPTPIQEKTLPASLTGRDVVGAAETGSGKTLAFGIPILEYIIKRKNNNEKQFNELVGLILTPTRELAIQIKDHLQSISKFSSINIMAIVGGMSLQKQQRLLEKNPNVIIATPGRLWEIFSEKDIFIKKLRLVRFLVLDEADRMLESGHFKELDHILSVLSLERQNTDHQDSNNVVQSRQTFVFSATLDKTLKEKLKQKKGFMIKNPKNNNSSGTIDELMQKLEFRDPDPVYVDITPENAVVTTLQESKIDCLAKDKDLYVYYFITCYPGRTLIFVNSIDSIRRLVPILKLLKIEVIGFHAQMQQRQRLKNLDRFKANDNVVMVASDVASRGLDIHQVDHVIHYHLPRSSDIYVHRSGRTARASKEGVSLILCSPEELSLYRKLCQKLNKVGIAEFPTNGGFVNMMKQRIELARQIDQDEHKLQKTNFEEDWYKKAAKDLDVDLDDNSS
ncbi:1879_t:CDS:10 [Entrophospora sp. SA101]|nr:14203_t:CDS:10 [Entrophospora sp. SA101]CAJ0839609.1 2546_t:CDS:10 [Entrophospora sp. SA101]CAJ0889500.1 1879_t:CDS:10 [Entrophospora sp. SA101]